MGEWYQQRMTNALTATCTPQSVPENFHLDVLEELKSWDVDIYATTKEGVSAVHIAAQTGELDVLWELKSSRNVRPSSPPCRSVSAQRDRHAKI